MSYMVRSAVVGLTALVAVSTGSAMAQEKGKLEEVLARGHLIVGTGSTNAPWHFKDESGNLVGFDIDIAKIVAKGLFGDDTKIEFVDQASDARIPNVTTGKVDITCQFMTVTAERAQQVNVTIPYYREGVGLLVHANGKMKTYDELKAAGSGATVSVLQNVYAEEMVHQALPEAKVDQYESVDLIYQALNSGRADAAATDQSSAAMADRDHARQVPGCRLWLEPAELFLRGQARRPGLAQLRQHRAARGHDRRRVRHLFRLVQEVVRRRPAAADDWLPGRVSVETGARDPRRQRPPPMGYTLNFGAVWRDFDLLLSGLGLGLGLAIVSIFIGCVIGLAAAFAHELQARLAGGALRRGYVTAIRNTPLLVLILFAYLRPAAASASASARSNPSSSRCRSMPAPISPKCSAARLLALPRGLREAGLAIGLTEWQTKVWIIIPVMLRNALPALGNNFISLFKDTSLAAAIAVPELTFYARQDQRRDLPGGRDLAGGQPDVCRRLLPDRRWAALASSGAWRSRADMFEQGTFLYEFWVARWAILQGLGTTVLVSLLAIVLGTFLGIFVGLVLIYGRVASRFVVAHAMSISSAARRCSCWCWRASTCCRRSASS